MTTRQQQLDRQTGFTLIEILLVVAIIAILAAVVIVAINPSRQLSQSKDAQRRSNVNTILNAVHQYSVDNSGNLPSSITNTATEICKSDGVAVCTNLIDLSVLVANELYIVSIPTDPTGVNTNGVGYTIMQSTNGRVTVAAPDTEIGSDISVSR